MDKPVFEICNPITNDRIKIYKNGLVEGLPKGYTVVINRIPELIKVKSNA